MRPVTTIQLDLFDAPTAGTSRLADAHTMLAESLPYTMTWLFDRSPIEVLGKTVGHSGGDWAYQACTAGIRFEHNDTWDGWGARPAHLITWAEVDQIAADPRLAPVRTWAADAGRTVRPHELWPHGSAGWHEGYFKSDRADPEWPRRLAAWRLLIDVLTDRAQMERLAL